MDLDPERYRTVEDVLSTMADRGLLTEAPDFDSSVRYLVGPVLQRAAPWPSDIEPLSDRPVHQW